MSQNERIPNPSVVEWRTTINGVPKLIPISTFDSLIEGSVETPVVNLNGIGEGSYSASVAPRVLGENIISPIMPFSGELELTRLNLERIAAELPEAIARTALCTVNNGRVAGSYVSTRVDMIARSQSGPIGIRAFSESPHLFRNLALVQPFGLNAEQLGETTIARRKAVIHRLAVAALRANPFDVGNLRSSNEVASYFYASLRNKTLMKNLDVAVEFDMIDELKGVVLLHAVAMILGENDPLADIDEIVPEFNGTRVKVLTVPGTHATPGSKAGKHNLKTAYNWLRNAA